MNNNHPFQQKTAGIIRYSCGILFMLFSFCYLYCLQGEILAEAQFVYSKGVTSYHIFFGAVIITVVLQIIQWIVSLLSRLPSRWHALSYLPSMLMLAILTDVNKPALEHFTFGAWVWIFPLVLVAYIVLAIVVHVMDADFEKTATDIKSQIYPNFIILFVLILIAGAIPQSTDVYHFELKAERLILEKDYEGASEVGKQSLRTTARLTQLRMYALDKQGLLAERLFEYPQYDGSRGLLDVTDTLSSYRFSPQSICAHLGAFCGKNIHSTNQYYQLVLGDSVWNQHTVDYYLCSLLLDRKLAEFKKQLPRYYDLADSIPHAYDRLPKAYREAMLLVGDHESALNGKIVIGADTIATLADAEFVAQFKDYNELKAELKNQTERINKTHREFGKTYWWYYDFSHLATGELQNQ